MVRFLKMAENLRERKRERDCDGGGVDEIDKEDQRQFIMLM